MLTLPREVEPLEESTMRQTALVCVLTMILVVAGTAQAEGSGCATEQVYLGISGLG